MKRKLLINPTGAGVINLLLFAVILPCVFTACKTKEMRMSRPVESEVVFIQVADKIQMAFGNLKYTVFLSDGTVLRSMTDIEGKAAIKPNPYVQIVKIVYDFTDYKRPEGRLLAIKDFKLVKKLKANPNSQIQECPLNLTTAAGTKVLLILDVL